MKGHENDLVKALHKQFPSRRGKEFGENWNPWSAFGQAKRAIIKQDETRARRKTIAKQHHERLLGCDWETTHECKVCAIRSE